MAASQFVFLGVVLVASLILDGLGGPADAAADVTGSIATAPRVRTAVGEVRGRFVEAGRGAAGFAAFLGIPYARPPVGPLRYRQPVPARAWRGALDATSDPPRCPQFSGEDIVGQEDCLYLNVYVPQEGSSGAAAGPLPVLVMVHGGNYESGSGRLDAFGPHFLVNQGVIMVSINYRLGVLGYVSLDTEQIPGNAGLKDLALAFGWIRDHIAAFGGDPNRVTALGYSTGASAVHLLSLLPATRDLMSRAVLLSGHAITPRAYTERHVQRAFALATILGAPENSTKCAERALRDATVEQILRAADDPRARAVGLPLPSPERRRQGAEAKLVTQDPESLLRQPRTSPMPILMSMDEREGLIAYYRWELGPRSLPELDEMLPRLLPADLIPGADTALQLGLRPAGPADAWCGPGPLDTDASLRLAKLIRNEYTDGGPIANDKDVFVQFLGAAFIDASSWRAIGFIANSSTDAAPLYLYKFFVDDAYNYVKKARNITESGATHTDDIGYLARVDKSPALDQDLTATGIAPKTLLRMTKMVTDFVKGTAPEGLPAVPSGRTASSLSGTSSPSWPLLKIGPGLRRSIGHADEAHFAFWASVYRDLRSKSSSIGRPSPSQCTSS